MMVYNLTDSGYRALEMVRRAVMEGHSEKRRGNYGEAARLFDEALDAALDYYLFPGAPPSKKGDIKNCAHIILESALEGFIEYGHLLDMETFRIPESSGHAQEIDFTESSQSVLLKCIYSGLEKFELMFQPGYEINNESIREAKNIFEKTEKMISVYTDRFGELDQETDKRTREAGVKMIQFESFLKLREAKA